MNTKKIMQWAGATALIGAAAAVCIKAISEKDKQKDIVRECSFDDINMYEDTNDIEIDTSASYRAFAETEVHQEEEEL